MGALNKKAVGVLVLCFVHALVAGRSLFAASFIYSGNAQGSVFRANSDGSEFTTLFTESDLSVGQIDIDSENGVIYGSDRGGTVAGLWKADIDGTGFERLISGAGVLNVLDLELDITNGKMYWYDISTGQISKANLDGTNVEPVVTGLPASGTGGFSLDLANGKIYYSSSGDQLKRADLDGTNIETISATPFYDVEIAPADNLIFAVFGTSLYSGPLDQSAAISFMYNTGEGIFNLDADSAVDRLLYVNPNTSPGRVGTIDFDGSNPAILFDGVFQMTGVTTFSSSVASVPEPTTTLLLGVAALALRGLRSRNGDGGLELPTRMRGGRGRGKGRVRF